MTPEKSDKMYDQIYNDLDKKNTDELLEIWKTNDRKVWSETAFKAVNSILKERLGSVPPQEPTSSEASPDDDSEEGTYYSIDKITSISSISNVLAWIILVGDFIAVIGYLWLGLKSNSVNLIQYLSTPANVINLLIWYAVYLLPGLFFFAVLRVLSEAIYVLVEIAENGRKH